MTELEAAFCARNKESMLHLDDIVPGKANRRQLSGLSNDKKLKSYVGVAQLVRVPDSRKIPT
jgi:hypothetical protein